MKSARGLLRKGLALVGSFTNVPSIQSNAIKRAFVLLAITTLPCLAFAGKTPTPIIYVSAVTDSSVSLYWTDSVSGEIDWSLERATVSTGPFVVIAQLAPNTTNYTDTTVLPGTTYYYRAGYMSSKGVTKTSGTLKVKTQVGNDTTPPTVTVTAPTGGEVWGGTITLSASATDNVNVSSVEFFINGSSVGRDTNSPFSLSFDTRTIASGSCALVAKAKDPAGNTGTSATVTFICDNSAPTVPLNVSATAPNCSQVNISWTASTDAGSGLQSYVIFRDGGFWREVSASSTSTIDTSVSASTSYSYAVAAKDNFGYQSAGSSPANVSVPSCADTIVPSIPTNVVATAVNCAQVNLKWNPSTDSGGSGLKGYEIYRNGIYIGLVLAPATNLIDNGVAAGTSYSYRVSSLDNADNFSIPSAAANVVTPACPDTTAPTVPGNVAVTATSCSQVSISWSASTDAGSGMQSYLVYKNGAFWREVSSTALSTTDTVVSASTSYSYAIAAKDLAGNQSANSTSASVTTPACPDTVPPTVPASVVATVASCSRVDVTWAASTDSGSGVKGYRVYRNGNMLQEVMSPTLSFSDTTVAASTVYSYAVTAFDNAGNVSGMSSGSSATPPSCGGVPGQFIAVTLLGATDSDYGMTVAVDPNGNFMAGGSVAGRPYFAKLSPSRQILWAYSLANAGSVQSVAFDPSGDVVLTGYFYATADFGGGPLTSAGGYDLFVAKYSSGGVLRWANRYGSSQGADFAGDESGNSVAVDSNGNIAVAGSFLDTVDFGTGPVTSRGGKDAFVVKFNSSGVALWSKTFGNSGTDDSATSVRFDAANNLFVGGRFSVDINLGGTNLTAVGSYDLCVAKFSPTGGHLWSKRAGGGGYDTVRGLAVDPAGDLLVTGDYRLVSNFDGVAFTGAGEEDVFLLKYTGSNGTQQWAKSFGSWNTDNGYAVGADSDRNVIIAGRLGAAMDFGGGSVSTPRNGFNIYVAKFNPGGTHLWSKAMGNGREEARGVAIGAGNYPFIAGRLGLTNNFGSGVFTNYGNNLNPDMMVLELQP